MYGMGFAWILAIFLWVLGAAALFGIIYFAVRLAALHALKAHTQWLNAGQPTTAAPVYPAAQPAPPVAAPAPAPQAPPVQAAPPAPPAPQNPDSPTTPLP